MAMNKDAAGSGGSRPGRFGKLFLIYLLALLLPLALFVLAAHLAGNVYSESFAASLADKHLTLQNTEGQKVVWIGGSSLPFGLRGDLVEEHLRMKSVDMGVYAALGTSAILEVSLDSISAGDVVVLAPELDTQTYSSYFNADVFWEAAYEDLSLIPPLSQQEKKQLFFHYFPFAFNRILHRKDAPTGTDVLYARSSFDERGDLSYPHPDNRMAGGYDPSQPISLDGLLTEDFYGTVIPFIKSATAKGADVFFTFSPTNGSAKAFTEKEETEFLQALRERLPCPVLSSPSAMTYGAEYFYNTNYHLNETGAVLHTRTLLEALLDALGMPAETGIEVPDLSRADSGEPGPVPGDEVTDNSFRMNYAGGVYYLTDVFGDAASAAELHLPSSYHGLPVAGFEAGAFRNCSNLEVLYVPDSYCMFPPLLFEGCGKLKAIHLAHTDPSSVSIPVSGLFDGTSPGLAVYLPAEAYIRFSSDYTWRIYRSYFKKEPGGVSS